MWIHDRYVKEEQKEKKKVHLVHPTSHSLWIIPYGILAKTGSCLILNDLIEEASAGGWF